MALMNLAKPKRILNLNSFLPPGGEDGLDLSYHSGTLDLTIQYEKTGGETGDARKVIRFMDAKYFFKTPFPGYSFFSCPDDRDVSLLSSLVEYEYSDMVEMDKKRYNINGYRHYRLFLHSVGFAVYVIAQSCEVLD